MDRIIAGLILVILAYPTSAADKFDPQARAKAVAPYVDAQTVIVAHFDLTRVDGAALARMTGEEGLKEHLAEVTGAGVREVYGVYSLADYPAPTPLIIVPVTGKIDVKKLAKQLGAEEGEQRDGAVLLGPKALLQRLKGSKPVARPELAKAFASAGDTSAQVLLLPTPDVRRALDEVMTSLPKAVGPIQTYTRGIQWAAAGLDLAGKMKIAIVIQAPDAAAAQALAKGFVGITATIARSPDINQALPGVAKLAVLLVPQVADSRLTLTLKSQAVTLLLAAMQQPVQAGARASVMNSLMQIGIAMHAYHDTDKHLPLAASLDKNKKPLLSWRVHLLPYLEQDALYKEFHLNEPWDSAHNKKLIARMPAIYGSGNAKLTAAGKTTFLAPIGKGTILSLDRKPVTLQDVASADGTSKSILVVNAEDGNAVIWTKPEDLQVNPQKPATGWDRQGFLALFADGHVQALPATMKPDDLLLLLQYNSGKPKKLP